jgi:hypothetical protein
MFAGIYLFGAGCVLVYAIRTDKPLPLLLAGASVLAGGWIFRSKLALASTALFAMAVVLLATGVVRFILRARKTVDTPPSPVAAGRG